MRVENLNHQELLESDTEGGIIRFAGQRALLLDAVALPNALVFAASGRVGSALRGHAPRVRAVAWGVDRLTKTRALGVALGFGGATPIVAGPRLDLA